MITTPAEKANMFKTNVFSLLCLMYRATPFDPFLERPLVAFRYASRRLLRKWICCDECQRAFL
jgi:hypothetical protein